MVFICVIAEYGNATIVIAVELIFVCLLILLGIIFSVFLRKCQNLIVNDVLQMIS